MLPGIIAVAIVVAAIVGVLVFARVGALHGRTFVLYTSTDAARGVIPGTEVWLAGQKVGLVDEIRFRPASSDTARRVLLELEILEEYRRFIRRDSRAQIRSGGTLIGAPVVHLSPGTAAAPVVAARDTLRSLPQGDTEELASRMTAAAKQFPELIANVKRIRELASTASGADGTGRVEEAAVRLEVLQENVSRLRDGLAGGSGSVGLAMRDRQLVVRGTRAAARADSIRTLLASDRITLGRFRRDTTLLREIAAVRDELSIVGALLSEPRGSAGRLTRDRAIAQELAGVERELAALAEDIKRDPLRYLAF